MNPHETFDLPASARVSLYSKGEIAAWDRLNSITGRTEISFAALRPCSPPETALALHSHARDFSIKKLKFKCLKKSVTDRLMAVGPYRSGEESRFLVHAGNPPLREAPKVAMQEASPQDAVAIEKLLNASLPAHARVPEAWIREDMFQPGWFNGFFDLGGERAGFGSAIRGAACGEINFVCLLPAWRRKNFGKSLFNALLVVLKGHEPAKLALNVETLNAPAFRLYESYQFRWDGDLYFNVYDK